MSTVNALQQKQKNDLWLNKFAEDVKIYKSIISDFQDLQENDIEGAFNLMKKSLQAYNRWSKITEDVRAGLKRGEKAELKDRLIEMCKYLKEVHITSRMIWKYAKDDLRNNFEG